MACLPGGLRAVPDDLRPRIEGNLPPLNRPLRMLSLSLAMSIRLPIGLSFLPPLLLSFWHRVETDEAPP